MLIRGKRNELCFNCKFARVEITSNIPGNLADSLLTNGISNLLWMDDLTSDILNSNFFSFCCFFSCFASFFTSPGGKKISSYHTRKTASCTSEMQ